MTQISNKVLMRCTDAAKSLSATAIAAGTLRIDILVDESQPLRPKRPRSIRIDRAKAEWKWSKPDDGLCHKCAVLKTDPLVLRAFWWKSRQGLP